MILALVLYILAVLATDSIAHQMIYPVVGWGFPLTGWKRWLVRVFAPFVFVGVVMWCLPVGVLATVAVLRSGRLR